MSAMLSRDSGRPDAQGSSQAKALTSTTTSGGSEAAGLAEEPPAALPGRARRKPFTPLTDDLEGGVDPLSNLLILHTLGGLEHNLGPDDINIR